MTRSLFAIAAVALGAAVLSACGQSTPPATTTTVPPSTTTPRSSAAKATVTSEKTSYGTILATGSGHALYMLTADSATKSVCTSAACTATWPPLTVIAVPSFGSGVDVARFGDLVRSTGAHQLTYGGHPLYTYSGDTAKGTVYGEGIASFGGTWYVISASTGKPVTATVSNSTTTSTAYKY